MHSSKFLITHRYCCQSSKCRGSSKGT